jgi:hypothetical protein
MSKVEKFWENATADDVARVMAGETVEARFRDDDHCGYTEGILAGWTKGDPSWLFSDQAHGQSYFETCQVYREPSWWTDKPDPGPGYRLLGKLPDEELKPGDECLGVSGAWGPSCQTKDGGHQVFGIWYRRRIEPVEPEPKHYVLRVGDSFETPSGNRTVVMPQGSTQRFLNVKAGDTIKTIHGQTITITEKGFEVTQ